MAWLRSYLVFGILLLVGCHSTPLKSPANSEVNSDNEWLKSYQWARAHAQDDSAGSCTALKKLAAEVKFPAREMARLRALEVCPPEEAVTFDRTELPIWLQDSAVDVQLKLAALRQDRESEMNLAVEKSKQKLPHGEKVKWMALAIQRAETIQNPEKLNELNTRLYKLAPRLDPQPEEAQFLAVAGDWRAAREFNKARAYYERVIKSEKFDLDDKIAALKGIRLSYKNARQNEKHLQAAKRLEEFITRAAKAGPSARNLSATLYDAQIFRARALWTQGQSTAAQAIFDKVERKLKGKVSLAELYWLKGRMAEERRDYSKVSHYLDLALKERFNDAEMRDKILWYSAWNERRRGNFPRAVEVLQEIDKKTQMAFTRQRALYWLGRTYAENKNEDEAKTVFTRLIDLDPLGYYGLLAHRQLGLPITLQAPPEAPRAETSAATGATDVPQIPMDVAIAEWLSALNEKDALTSYLDLASQSYKKQRDQSDEGWVTIFKYYARAGLYMKLYESLTTISPERRKSIFEHHPDLLFPQPWSEDVRSASQQFGVEEELIYAITRQESAFDTHARSLADAFGLMQLLPEVAEQLSSKYKIPYNNMEDLYNPKTNIYFGAAHLKELFQRNKGQFILAVASYNASEAAIHGWMKDRFRGDALEFIEEIPYEETRAYVRLVMRNLVFYSLLKSKSASIDFPDRVLKLEGT